MRVLGLCFDLDDPLESITCVQHALQLTDPALVPTGQNTVGVGAPMGIPYDGVVCLPRLHGVTFLFRVSDLPEKAAEFYVSAYLNVLDPPKIHRPQ